MDRDYDKLISLRRIIENSPNIYTLYRDLNSRRKADSKNILIICRTVKDAREAIKMSANNYLDKAKINLVKFWLKIDGTTFYFLPMSRLDLLTGLRYKEYYFDGAWNYSIGGNK